jgi:hypothetical protein
MARKAVPKAPEDELVPVQVKMHPLMRDQLMELARVDGDGNLSSYVRWLIREAWRRRAHSQQRL